MCTVSANLIAFPYPLCCLRNMVPSHPSVGSRMGFLHLTKTVSTFAECVKITTRCQHCQILVRAGTFPIVIDINMDNCSCTSSCSWHQHGQLFLHFSNCSWHQHGQLFLHFSNCSWHQHGQLFLFVQALFQLFLTSTWTILSFKKRYFISRKASTSTSSLLRICR